MTYYRRLAPVYDFLFARMYRGLRRRSLDGLQLRETDTVLLVGVGTGLDFNLLPPVRRAAGVDLVPAMLSRARVHAGSPGRGLILGDGRSLPFASGMADAVILHLVLSVAMDPRALLTEAVRVLRPGGQIAVCDHCAPPGRLSAWRRLATKLAPIFGTRFDRQLPALIDGLPVRVAASERRWFGCYQIARLERVPGHVAGTIIGLTEAARRAPRACPARPAERRLER